MSKEAFQEQRELVELFSEAIANEHQNIHVISMDDEWLRIKSPIIEQIKSISFLSAGPPLDDLVDSIVAKASNNQSHSHFNKERFEHLISATYDNISTDCDVSEQKGSISFSIFSCRHRTTGDLERYIAIYPRASMTKVAAYLQDYHSDLLSGADRLLVVRSEPAHELTTKQKETTLTFFPDAKILRFETLAKGSVGNSNSPEPLTDPDEFQIPQRWTTSRAGRKMELDAATVTSFCTAELQEHAQRRIVLLSGAGGAGKTHFARFLNDKLQNNGQEVFFLSAKLISTVASETTIASLYDAYAVCQKASGQNTEVSQEIFNLRFLVDSPTIIVDGLEEIVTMLGDRFSVGAFFEDCLRMSHEVANGRIIITSREGQLPSEISDFVYEYELQLFDENQSNDFFRRYFPHDSARANLAFRIAKEISTEGRIILPLICLLIAIDIENAADIHELQAQLDRGEFKALKNIETFIKRMIKREDKLGVSWPVDETMTALAELAVLRVNGPLDFELTRNKLTSILGSGFSLDSRIDDAIKNFVLFDYNNKTNSLTFKYDFVRTIFLAEFIANKFCAFEIEALTDEATLSVFETNLVPGSDVLNQLITVLDVGRAADFREILGLLLDHVIDGNVPMRDHKQYAFVVSNLFYLFLATQPNSPDRNENTAIAARFFSAEKKSGELHRPYFLLYNQDPKRTYKFALDSTKIIEGVFSGFEADANITADEDTYFYRCKFENALSHPPVARSSLWSANFDESCEFDQSFLASQTKYSATLERTEDRKSDELMRYLSQFSNGQSLNKIHSENMLSGTFSSRVGLDAQTIFDILKQKGIIVQHPERRRGLYHLDPTTRKSVRKFIFDHTSDALIDQVLSEL